MCWLSEHSGSAVVRSFLMSSSKSSLHQLTEACWAMFQQDAICGVGTVLQGIPHETTCANSVGPAMISSTGPSTSSGGPARSAQEARVRQLAGNVDTPLQTSAAWLSQLEPQALVTQPECFSQEGQHMSLPATQTASAQQQHVAQESN